MVGVEQYGCPYCRLVEFNYFENIRLVMVVEVEISGIEIAVGKYYEYTVSAVELAKILPAFVNV